jgi:uncharacterized membrane protein YdjX (TVP38/TMEM64 family)
VRKILKENRKEITKFLIVIVVLSFISITVSRWLRTDIIQEKIEHAGVWGPIIVITFIVASHIFAPVAGTPGAVVAFAAYGLFEGWLYLYIASLTSATINYYIARKLGRVWVERLAGKDSIGQIDKFVEIMGSRLLIIARVFGAPMYEFISYAAGFTNISFKRYIVITAIFIIIPGYVFSILIFNSLTSPLYLSLFFISMFIQGALFSWYTVNQYLKFKNHKN